MKNVILSSILFGAVAFVSTSCQAIVVENGIDQHVMMSVHFATTPRPGAGNARDLYSGHQHIADRGVVAFDIPQANIAEMTRYVTSHPNEHINLQLVAWGLAVGGGNTGLLSHCTFRINRADEINTLHARSFKLVPHNNICHEVTPPNVGAPLNTELGG